MVATGSRRGGIMFEEMNEQLKPEEDVQHEQEAAEKEEELKQADEAQTPVVAAATEKTDSEMYDRIAHNLVNQFPNHSLAEIEARVATEWTPHLVQARNHGDQEQVANLESIEKSVLTPVVEAARAAITQELEHEGLDVIADHSDAQTPDVDAMHADFRYRAWHLVGAEHHPLIEQVWENFLVPRLPKVEVEEAQDLYEAHMAQESEQEQEERQEEEFA
jgi:hypothetical protein